MLGGLGDVDYQALTLAAESIAAAKTTNPTEKVGFADKAGFCRLQAFAWKLGTGILSRHYDPAIVISADTTCAVPLG